MVAGNGEFFQLARNGRAGGKHGTPISELRQWQDQPQSAGVGSLSEEENRDMITVNRIQDPWDRIATVVERYVEFLMSSRDEQKKPESVDYLTPAEVAAILRVHVQTVMEWCRDGKLEAFKSGGHPANGKGGKWVIPRESVDHYLRRHQLIHGSRNGGAK
jgi:excisionase family DNA binding protein